MLMAPGMIFTIEPMINMGRPDIFVDDSNGWTIHTDGDRLPSAQREIMVLRQRPDMRSLRGRKKREKNPIENRKIP